jgi:hypothetical protein
MINIRLADVRSLSTAKAQLATETALPSGRRANKRPRRSAAREIRKCSENRKQAPTAQEGENELLDGFEAEEIFKRILEEPTTQFDGDFESTWQDEFLDIRMDENNNDLWSNMPTLDDLLLLDDET